MLSKEKAKASWKWYYQTSALVGMPIVLMLLAIGIQKLVFTGTCQIGGYNCEYAFGSSDGMAQYMGELLESNPGVDIVAKKKR